MLAPYTTINTNKQKSGTDFTIAAENKWYDHIDSEATKKHASKMSYVVLVSKKFLQDTDKFYGDYDNGYHEYDMHQKYKKRALASRQLPMIQVHHWRDNNNELKCAVVSCHN